MKESYKNALVEVNEALKYTDENLVKKIPQSFKKFIIDNMSSTYSFSISENENPNFSKEAEIILSLIYRNYFCSKEEKAHLLECELQERKKNNKR